MADRTPIEWTDATWNPLRGCTRVSEGCRNCYAERVAARFSGPGKPFEGIARWAAPGEPRWTGAMRLAEARLADPLRWRRPRNIFVNSMTDLFHEDVPDAWIDETFAVAALAPHHTFQALTKRPERMLAWTTDPATPGRVERAAGRRARLPAALRWPLPNVWLGTSVENRHQGVPRIEVLRRVPAALRMLSVEPLLEDLGPLDLAGIGWVLLGGESGRGARPMHPDWARAVRGRCVAAGVPFFFKQWGAWREAEAPPHGAGELRLVGDVLMQRCGKARAGRLLDGRTWDERPPLPQAAP